jgi:hypothetical protein
VVRAALSAPAGVAARIAIPMISAAIRFMPPA